MSISGAGASGPEAFASARLRPLKQRIRSGESLSGCFAFLPSPAAVEILALAGFDFVIIDLEHAPKNWEVVEQMIRAAQLHKLPALVRVPEISLPWMLGALEMGAEGLVLPMLNGVAQVREALDAMLYPPQGRRGTCTQTRAAAYGAMRGGFARHAATQNERLVLMGLVETREGLGAMADLLALDPGLDLVSVGRSDLASSIGHPGQADHPEVMRATHAVLQQVNQHPVSSCRSAMVVYTPADAATWRPDGCRVFIAPSESGLLLDAGAAWVHGARSVEAGQH